MAKQTRLAVSGLCTIGNIRPVIQVGSNRVLNMTVFINPKRIDPETKEKTDSPLWFDLEIWERADFYSKILRPGSYIYIEGKVKGVGRINLILQAFIINLLDPIDKSVVCPNCNGIAGSHAETCTILLKSPQGHAVD